MKSLIHILIPLILFNSSFLQAQDRGMKPIQVNVDKKSSLLDYRNKAQKVLTSNVGHNEKVTCIAFSPDGNYIVSGSMDKTIKVWNIQMGQEIKTFKGHTTHIVSLAFSTDGKYIASISYYGTMKLWNCQTGHEVRTFKCQTKLLSVAFSPDGKQMVSGGWDKVIKLWDSQSGQEIRSFKGHTAGIGSVAFGPNGKHIISGGWDKVIKLWDSQSGQEIRSFKGHREGITSIAFSPDGEYIVSGSYDNTIKLWDSQTGQEIRSFKGHIDDVSSVAFSPDGKYIVSGSYDGALKLWNSQTGQEIRILKGQTDNRKHVRVTCIRFSPNGNYIASGYNDNTIKLWNSQTGQEIKTFKGRKDKVRSIAISNDGKYIVLGNISGTLKLWDNQARQEVKTFRELNGEIKSVSFSPGGKYIVSGSGDGAMKLWDSKSGQEIRSFKGHTRDISSAVFSPDGRYIASGSYDETIKLWNSQTGQEIRTYIGHKKPVLSIAFSPDGKYIVSVSWQTVKLWDSQTGQEIRSFKGHTRCVESVAFSPDGKYIVSGSSRGDYTIKLWNSQTGQEIKTLKGHKGSIKSLSFSPDGKYIVSGSDDGTMKLWDSQSGQEIRTFKGHTRGICSVAFSSDGKYIVSGSDDGTMNLWEMDTGKVIATLVCIANSEDYIVITPEGRFDGTEKGMELLYYVEGMNIIPLASLFEQFYTPNLLARVMAGEKFEAPEIKIDEIKLPPLVEITSPDNNSKLNKNEVKVTLTATDQGGGIDEIRIYLNGKLIETTQRGFKPVEQVKEGKTITFTISLVNGENKIKATAFSNQRTAAIPDEIIVFYDGIKKTANLYMIIVGIDNYKNPNYKLNYALADATAIKEIIVNGSNDIFGSVTFAFITDTDATRTRILQEFNKQKATVKQEDVFIFYYAGHGVMSEEDKSQFYVIPYDVTQLYGDNKMLYSSAISASELQTFSAELKAQKQMFIFDACQSGGMTELLIKRGSEKEKAIAQLARSTGTYWLAASNSEQFVTEFSELGHAMFTYTLLLGLQGQADGGSKDKRITVEELSAFIKNKLPELSEKHKGTPQYPTSYGYGQDFPIIIVE